MFQGMNIIEFGKRLQTNADCLQYLMDTKWGGNSSHWVSGGYCGRAAVGTQELKLALIL